MKYRKLPVEVEAVEFEFEKWLYERHAAYPMVDCGEHLGTGFGINGIYPFINTLEGKMMVTDGDYIIQGVNGEYYPCKPDIFLKTYEPVE